MKRRVAKAPTLANRLQLFLNIMGTSHIENRRLFEMAAGRLKLEIREHDHLHQCEVCQAVLYVFVSQPTINTSRIQSDKNDAA
jgi:hypothetical protein